MKATEQTLFKDSETFQKERPGGLTEKQSKDFFLLHAEEVIQNGWSRYSLKETIAEDLRYLIEDSWHKDNGFEMGKELDDGIRCKGGYNVDIEFCEWLEGDLAYDYDEKVAENVKDWVKAHNPTPKFQKGDLLKITANEFRSKELRKNQSVYVTGIKPDVACYFIHPDKDRNGGYVIAFEKVESHMEKL